MVDFYSVYPFFLANPYLLGSKILLVFTSILGSIVPLFLMAKNKKIDYFALFFSQTQTELPWHAPLGGGSGDPRPTDGLREIHFILSLGFIAKLRIKSEKADA